MLAIIVFLLLLPISVLAEPLHYAEVKTLSLKGIFKTKSDWHVTVFQPEGERYKDDYIRFGDIPAKICFWKEKTKKEENCTKITSAYKNQDLIYQYQTVKELSVETSPVSKNILIKFVAEYSGGGSGLLHQISFWKYDKVSDRFEVEGLITLTEQGEHKWVDWEGDIKEMFITADANWKTDETHFSLHHFYVDVYQYDKVHGLTKILTYLTPKKYSSFEEVDKINVISHEIPNIKKLLESINNGTIQ